MSSGTTKVNKPLLKGSMSAQHLSTNPSKLADKRVLVTGGAGFIGSELVRQLLDLKARVSVLDNFSSGKAEYLRALNVEVIRGSVTNDEIVQLALEDQEFVFHLAALPFIPDAYADPRPFFETNVEGTVLMAWNAARTKSLRSFVHVSSSEVYGSAQSIPMNEDHPTIPHSTYAASKLSGDRAIATMQKENDLPAVIIRPFNSYGPRFTQPYIIPEIMTNLLNSNAVTLGNVDASRDFTFVADTARGIILAATSDSARGETINLGSGISITIRQLVKEIADLMKRDTVTITFDETRLRPWDVEKLECDYTKAKRILGWEPKISLREGLLETLKWLKANPVRLRQPFRGWPRSDYKLNREEG